VKNISLAIDDETYRRARIRAAELDTSVSALVKTYLIEISAGVAASNLPQMQKKQPSFAELAAELRALTAGTYQTPSEVLQREGRSERLDAVLSSSDEQLTR